MGRSTEKHRLTREELRTLPRWARVAFAARCARRVAPLYRADTPGTPQENRVILDDAIRLAECAAERANSREWFNIATRKVSAPAVERIAGATTNWAYVAACASNSAANAASSAMDSTCAADAAAIAAGSAGNAANAGNHQWRTVTKVAMERDFELLRAAAQREGWNDDTPVPPEFFGTLWPEGAPAGWPIEDETSELYELVLEMDVPVGVAHGELETRVSELAVRIDTLHRAYGGRGIQLRRVEISAEVARYIYSPAGEGLG